MTKEVKTTLRCTPFSALPIGPYRLAIEDDGTVRVWDSVAGHYTLCHALSGRTQKRLFELAFWCPFCGQLHHPEDGQPGYSCGQ